MVEIDYYFGTTGIAEGILGQGALSDNKGMLELDDCTDLVRRLRSNRRQNKEVREQKQIQRRTFTGWIPKDSELAGGSALAGLEGKKVRITGTIELYKGKPEIKVMSKEQITPE